MISGEDLRTYLSHLGVCALLMLASAVGGLLGPCPLAAEEDPPPPAPILRSLKVKGAQLVPAAKVKEELTLSLPSRWPWKKAPLFKSVDLDGDLERLKTFYRRQGFYHAKIDAQVQEDDKGRVDVVIKVAEGPWIMVREVKLDVPDPDFKLDLGVLADKRPLVPGQRFTEEKYEALKRLYLDHLQDHGYPRARVDGKVFLDEELNTARLALTVRPGPLTYFGEIRVQKDAGVPPYLILRKLTFKEGDVFSIREMYDSQRRLYALDLFKSVSLTPEEVPEEARAIPIAVEVQPNKKAAVKVGLGYGDVDEFRAKLGLRLRNLGGGGRLLDLDSKYSFRESRIMGTFTNPQLWATHTDLVLQGGWVYRDYPGFNDRAYFTQARLERDLPWRFRGYVGHGLEFARPFNIPTETLLILDTKDGKLFTASMVLMGLRQDTTDSLIDPTRGHILSATGEIAPDFLGSNLQFARAVLESRKYQRLGKTDLVLAGRLKFGIIEPIQNTQEIPVFRRFFAGGSGSNRGYRFDYLGPRNPSGTPIGGTALLEGSLEARIPLYKEFRGVAFLDFGNVFLKPRDVDVGQLKYASGLGVRYLTPIGPIGLDLGFPLNRIDPRRDPAYRFIFTVGQEF